MTTWPQHPSIYEINTWVWLEELSRRHGRRVTLEEVPEEEWDAIAWHGFDAVWLMGVWERSPLGIRIANENTALTDEFKRTLPDFTLADNVGSPYCVRRYVVDTHLGGDEGLAAARDRLARRGMRLVLDYVPNHVALDHPALATHPDFFIRGSHEDLEQEPDAFFEVDGQVIARGRDPNFPPWPDVAQVNAFSDGLRSAVVDTLIGIAGRCDGMRCDMAMLMTTEVFSRTWGYRAGGAPDIEFWPQVIGAVRQRDSDVVFIAEAYWDMEAALHEQGFDYCYDKRLYDRLEHEDARSVRAHLSASIDYQRRLVRFIENHDEPRAAATLQPQVRQEAAAIVSTTLPGMRLLHQGQLEGKRVRIPVFLGRGPDEPEDPELRRFYDRLLQALRNTGGLRGDWSMCQITGWSDNLSCDNLLAWTWREDDRMTLIIVNYAGTQSQGLVHLPWSLSGSAWRLQDPITGETFDRSGHDMQENGLYVDLPAWGHHFLQFLPVAEAVEAMTRSAT